MPNIQPVSRSVSVKLPPPSIPSSPELIFNQLGMTCGDWGASDTAERTRRVILAFWPPLAAGHLRIWTKADQQRVQQIIDTVERYCLSQSGNVVPVATAPAGQIIAPFYQTLTPSTYPLTAMYWFSKTGLSCTGWSVMTPSEKISLITRILSSEGQMIPQAAVLSLINAIDVYCAGAAYTSNFLSPYAYPYAPYGFGYPIRFAFPFIVRSTRFSLPPGRIGAPFPRTK